MTWLQRSLPLRPACLLSACSGLSTPRFGRSDLSSRLGSATGCSSACPDRTLTCKKNTSSSGRTIVVVDLAQRFQHIPALLRKILSHFHELPPPVRQAVRQQDLHAP